MYEQDRDAETPPDGEIIWRYMSLDKYIDLIYRKELFLCRLDKFVDPWEGTWTKQEKKTVPPWGEDDTVLQEFKKFSFINCWHMNQYESAAMWDLYSSKDAGIAIKTTIEKLKESLKEESEDLHIGKVQYEDNYDDVEQCILGNSDLPTLAPVFRKRKSFEHEKEVRLVFWTTDHKPFYYAKVDLRELFDYVYLSPTMEDWLVESIKGISKKFGIEENLFIKSDLYNQNVK